MKGGEAGFCCDVTCSELKHRMSSHCLFSVNLTGPVKSFYERVSFQKMVSYSVRSRVGLRETIPLSEG